MENERKVAAEKKRQEKEYFLRTMEENKRNQALAAKQKEKERQEDIRLQEAYAKKLEKEDQDRLDAIAAREKRAQEFMNRMADGVLKDMGEADKREAEMVAKYEALRERKMRKEEEKKNKKRKQIQQEVLATLVKQEQEKRDKAREAKLHFNEQAEMWKKENDLWEIEEKRLKEKIKQINKDTESFLKRQQQEKQ